MADELSHVADDGSARMVDVAGKADTARAARAGATVLLSEKTLSLLRQKALPKGDVLNTARVAAVMAAKRTHELIPMCHPLALTFVGVEFDVLDEPPSVAITAEARTTGKTGVEMEALTAASVAALTIYDMVKAVQKDVVVTDVRLLSKTGGKSGDYQAP